jgi:hypothetical protein
VPLRPHRDKADMVAVNPHHVCHFRGSPIRGGALAFQSGVRIS